MARPKEFKRIVVEDFPTEHRATVGKIASIVNQAMEELYGLFNNNLNFSEHFNSQVKDIEVTVDATGTPKSATSFKSSLKGSCKGIWVVKAENLTDSRVYPTGAPFISYEESGGQVVIKRVNGLVANNKYLIRVIPIG